MPRLFRPDWTREPAALGRTGTATRIRRPWTGRRRPPPRHPNSGRLEEPATLRAFPSLALCTSSSFVFLQKHIKPNVPRCHFPPLRRSTAGPRGDLEGGKGGSASIHTRRVSYFSFSSLSQSVAFLRIYFVVVFLFLRLRVCWYLLFFLLLGSAQPAYNNAEERKITI